MDNNVFCIWYIITYALPRLQYSHYSSWCWHQITHALMYSGFVYTLILMLWYWYHLLIPSCICVLVILILTYAYLHGWQQGQQLVTLTTGISLTTACIPATALTRQSCHLPSLSWHTVHSTLTQPKVQSMPHHKIIPQDPFIHPDFCHDELPLNGLFSKIDGQLGTAKALQWPSRDGT